MRKQIFRGVILLRGETKNMGEISRSAFTAITKGLIAHFTGNGGTIGTDAFMEVVNELANTYEARLSECDAKLSELEKKVGVDEDKDTRLQELEKKNIMWAAEVTEMREKVKALENKNFELAKENADIKVLSAHHRIKTYEENEAV
jgi:hypothetical protein